MVDDEYPDYEAYFQAEGSVPALPALATAERKAVNFTRVPACGGLSGGEGNLFAWQGAIHIDFAI